MDNTAEISAFQPKPNPLDSQAARDAIECVKAAHTILLTTHDGPDGDGIGSEIALARALRKAGRKVWIVNADDCARAFKFLDSNSDVIVWNEKHEHAHPALFDEVDLVILVDTSEVERVGRLADRLRRRGGPIVAIDHHQINERSIPGVIGPEFSSTGELMVRVIDALGLTITKDVAVPLYGAILSDTQQFRFVRRDAEVFAAAARLVAAGADAQAIAGKMFGTMTRDRLTLMNRIMASSHFMCGGRLIWSVMTPETLADISVDRDEIRTMVNMLGDIEGVEISVFFKVFRPGFVKVSMRSKEGIVISDIAEQLGGGGHKQAAGADVEGDLDAIRMKTIDLLTKKLESRH